MINWYLRLLPLIVAAQACSGDWCPQSGWPVTVSGPVDIRLEEAIEWSNWFWRDQLILSGAPTSAEALVLIDGEGFIAFEVVPDDDWDEGPYAAVARPAYTCGIGCLSRCRITIMESNVMAYDIVAHEIGHCFGLALFGGHDDPDEYPGSIMNSTVVGIEVYANTREHLQRCMEEDK